MRFVRTWLVIAATLAAVTTAAAQTTSGTISGHVVDGQGLALPGVTVNAASPNLQGVRSVTTSSNGDYIFSALPSGNASPTGICTCPRWPTSGGRCCAARGTTALRRCRCKAS